MREVTVAEVTKDMKRFLRLAQEEEVVITEDGKPVGFLAGFKSEDDWFEFQLERDPRFLKRIAQARKSIEDGKGIRLEDVDL